MFDKSNFVKTILFLGYDSSKTKIIDSIRKLGVRVIHQDKKEIEESKFESVDLVISFGYRHLLSESIVEKYSPIINLIYMLAIYPLIEDPLQIFGLSMIKLRAA